MNSRLSAFVVASAILAAAGATVPAVAATSQTVNVPFSFTVGGHQLPAGTYSVHQDLAGNIVNLQGADQSNLFTSVAIPSGAGDRVVLKFSNDGRTHVLQAIQFGSFVTPRLDHKTRPAEDVSPQYPAGQ